MPTYENGNSMIPSHEAEDIWNLAHTVKLFVEGGQGNAIDDRSRNSGDGKYIADWVADVRKLVSCDLDTFLLDCVYGDSNITPDVKSRRGAMIAIRTFGRRLHDKPEVFNEAVKIRFVFFGN